MTETSDGVDPPFSKRSIQITIAAIALLVSLWQAVALTGVSRRAGHGHGEDVQEARRWGELSGSGHPLIQIDINRAGPRELSLLAGVGPILARRIVEDRQRRGPFESLEALARVHGIGDTKIEQIQLLGYVSGDPSGRRGEPPSGPERQSEN